MKPGEWLKRWRRLAIILLICAAGSAPLAQGLRIVDPDVDSRVIVLRRAGVSDAIAGRSVARIVQRTNGTLELGFVHSGYTAPDADGRTALLTVTIHAPAVSLSASDLAELAQKGLRVNSDIRVQALTRQIDVELPDDLAEEARIRQAAGLPKPLAAGVTTLPIQLRWTNQDGKRLYRLLTADNGLRFVVRERFVVKLSTAVTVALQPKIVGALIEEAGTAGGRFEWTGGKLGLAMAIADRGGFRFSVPDGTPAGTYPAYAQLRSFTDALGTARCEPDGSCSIMASTLRSMEWSTELGAVDVELPARAVSMIAPGRTLDSHAQYVKDLSGSVPGLKALLGVK